LLALHTRNAALAHDLASRLAQSGRTLPWLTSGDSASFQKFIDERMKNLSVTEEFLHTGLQWQIPAEYRQQ
jgi:hypothetical protein